MLSVAAREPLFLDAGPVRPPAAAADREIISPYKMALLALIQQYCELRQSAAPLTPRCRRDVCTLLLQLLHGPELDGQQLRRAAEQRSLLPRHLTAWYRRLHQLHRAGVEGLAELVSSLQLLLDQQEGGRRAPVSATSVVGLFLRRMILAYTRLPFDQVVRVFSAFSVYYSRGRFPQPDAAELGPDQTDSSDLMDLSLDPESAQQPQEEDQEPADSGWTQGPSRRQAELLVSTQLDLLQVNERLALEPAQLQRLTAELLRDNADLPEAHFLTFLNCLRMGEYCGAVHSLYHCFDRTEGGAGAGDEPARGLRYAALSLAALHARFGHRRAAAAAVREAVTMSQDSNDPACLQQALSWLYSLLDDQQVQQALVQQAVVRSSQLGLHELAALGVQNTVQLLSRQGGRPADLLEYLSRSDQLTCHHSLPELMCCSYSVRAALCTLYGRPQLASLCSQLLLGLDTSGAARDGSPYCGQPLALAACCVASALSAAGQYQPAALVLSWGVQQFPAGSREAALCASRQLQLEASRTLLAGRCQQAEQAAAQLAALDPAASRLLRAQLALLRGELDTAERLLVAERPAEPEARLQELLLRAEVLSAAGRPAAALEPLLAGLALSSRLRLRTGRRTALLLLASLQLRLGLPQQASRLARSLTLPVLSHGSQLDRARLHLLLARCQLAAADTQPALQQLSAAAQLLTGLQAWLPLKYVLHLRAVTLHRLGDRKARNAAASQFRQLITQHPSLDGPHLVRIM